MKHTALTGLLLLCSAFTFLQAAPFTPNNGETPRLNFFVSARTKKIDPAMKSAQWQARMVSLLHKNVYCMVVDSGPDLLQKMLPVLQKRQARIGSIWFDSHGHFYRRHSSFQIGMTEISYRNLRDSGFGRYLLPLAPYCDSLTRVGIGSCFGGARYHLQAVDRFAEQYMYGDSLMVGVGQLLNGATVYASESFVMSRLGMFTGGYILAGGPLRKRFEDPVFKPVWENVGNWNAYSTRTNTIVRAGTVKLDGRCNISCNERPYLSFAKNKKKQARKLARLEKGNYNLAFFYQAI